MSSASVGGTVMVSAYSTATSDGGFRYCKVDSWFPTFSGSADLEVNVRCFNFLGQLANSRFSLSYGLNTINKVGSAAYVWGDQPTAASYTPNTFYQNTILSANSDTSNYSTTASSGTITITRTGFGSYSILVPNENAVGATNVMVKSYGGDDTNFCWVNSWAPSGSSQKINIGCGTTFNSSADSRFVLQFGTTQSFIF